MSASSKTDGWSTYRQPEAVFLQAEPVSVLVVDAEALLTRERPVLYDTFSEPGSPHAILYPRRLSRLKLMSSGTGRLHMVES